MQGQGAGVQLRVAQACLRACTVPVPISYTETDRDEGERSWPWRTACMGGRRSRDGEAQSRRGRGQEAVPRDEGAHHGRSRGREARERRWL